MSNPTVLFIIGALGIIGFVILLYVGMQMLREERTAKDRKDGAAPDPAPAPPAAGEAAPVAPAKPAPPKPNPGRSKGSAHEVLRVLRDNLTGRLVIEIAGRRYASLDELNDPALTDGLLTTLNDLRAFTGGAALPPAEAPLVAPALTARALVTPPPAAALPAGAPAAPAKPLPPPTMNPFKQLAVLRELAKNPPPEPKSITAQVDEVLQAQILGTPLAERKLRMRTGLRGEAQFDLDGESYPSVDEVPDMEVREALKAAIAAWEKTQ